MYFLHMYCFFNLPQCISKCKDLSFACTTFCIFADVFVEDPKLPIINTTGCSYSRYTYSRYTYTDCKLKQVELQCNNSRRIQIVSSKYGNIQLKSEESSSNDARVASQLQQPIQCPAGILISCNASRTDSSYSSSQQYDLYKMCSWKSSCRPPSLGANFAHSISHRCVPGMYKMILFTIRSNISVSNTVYTNESTLKAFTRLKDG